MENSYHWPICSSRLLWSKQAWFVKSFLVRGESPCGREAPLDCRLEFQFAVKIFVSVQLFSLSFSGIKLFQWQEWFGSSRRLNTCAILCVIWKISSRTSQSTGVGWLVQTRTEDSLSGRSWNPLNSRIISWVFACGWRAHRLRKKMKKMNRWNK